MKQHMPKGHRWIAASVLLALSAVLSSCSSFNTPSFDPQDLFDFLDTKKALPGQRKAVFPDGVPGLEQGVPKDLYKGARASTNTAVEPPPPPVAEPPKQRRRTAARPQRQPEPVQTDTDGADAAAEEGVAAAPPAPPPPRRRSVQRQQPAAQQPAERDSGGPAPFPAPLPSGSFAR